MWFAQVKAQIAIPGFSTVVHSRTVQSCGLW
jgi:hypothetical protein